MTMTSAYNYPQWVGEDLARSGISEDFARKVGITAGIPEGGYKALLGLRI